MTTKLWIKTGSLGLALSFASQAWALPTLEHYQLNDTAAGYEVTVGGTWPTLCGSPECPNASVSVVGQLVVIDLDDSALGFSVVWPWEKKVVFTVPDDGHYDIVVRFYDLQLGQFRVLLDGSRVMNSGFE